MNVIFPEKILLPFGRIDKLNPTSFHLWANVLNDPRTPNALVHAATTPEIDASLHFVVEDSGAMFAKWRPNPDDDYTETASLEYMYPRRTMIPFALDHKIGTLFLSAKNGKLDWKPHGWSYQNQALERSNLDDGIRAMIRLRNHIQADRG